MERIDGTDHLRDVEPGMVFFEAAGGVEQGPEVTSTDKFLACFQSRDIEGRSTDHSKEDMLLVLEGIEELDEPVGFGGRQDIALDQDVTDLGDNE